MRRGLAALGAGPRRAARDRGGRGASGGCRLDAPSAWVMLTVTTRMVTTGGNRWRR